MRILVIQSIGFCFAFGLGCFADADVVFFDDTFDTSDYTLIVLGDGTAGHTQELSGGNPDEFLNIQTQPTAVTGSTVAAYHLNSSFIYDPSTSGAIESVAWSFNYRNITNAHFLALALVQDFVFYTVDGGVRMGGGGNWTFDGNLMDASDLPAGLDITSTGSPITFGIYTANTYDPVFGDNPNVSGYDNLGITITTIPEPGTLIPVLVLLLAAKLRAR